MTRLAIYLQDAHPIEEAMEYIEEDELLEITPTTYRLRKRILDPKERRKERVPGR